MFSYQSAAAAHGEGALHQGDGLGDSSHYSGHHLGLLGHSNSAGLVHSDDGSGGGGRGRRCRADLSRRCFQHAGGRVTDLRQEMSLSSDV